MKKNYFLILGFVGLASLSKAQDTIFYESFDFQLFYDELISDVQPPPGVTADTLWYDWDGDGLIDASTQGTRPGGWFAVQPFSDVDTMHLDGSPNTAIGSNSWIIAPFIANNWLITPNIQLGANDTLFWRSAPVQTPRYLDGYEVRLSTSTNLDTDFTNLLFTAAEMTGTPTGGIGDTVYSNFTFAPSGSFVHGQDGTYIDPTDITAANPAHTGQLRPFSVPLTAYANQNVFIAFVHNSTDDNLISIDDVLIRGNHAVGVSESVSSLNLNIFPNPATERAQLNFELLSQSSVTITIYDVAGKVVYSENKGTLPNGRHFANINTSALAKGFYTVSVRTGNANSIVKLLVK